MRKYSGQLTGHGRQISVYEYKNSTSVQLRCVPFALCKYTLVKSFQITVKNKEVYFFVYAFCNKTLVCESGAGTGLGSRRNTRVDGT